jgi:hypothetical protein
MSRLRRIANPAPRVVPLNAPVERYVRHFVAITFEHVVDGTPAVKFQDATGKILLVGLTPDAEKLWRRMNGGR